jgi:hypothetical protein
VRLLKRKESKDFAAEFEGSTDELFAEIHRLTDANNASPDRDTERRLVYLRHQAGVRILDEGDKQPQHPDPDGAALPAAQGIPEISPDDLTPALLRAGILRDGCLLVRGLVGREDALRFADEIDRAFAEREKHDAGGEAADGYYDEITLGDRFEKLIVREWIKQGGGLLAPDAPKLTFEMIELYRNAGVPELVEGYLGEPGLLSVHKTTLRKAEPTVDGAWHQDGAFMGKVRSLNLWLSLSRCGDIAPGLDIVPVRLDHLAKSAMPDDPTLYYLVGDETAAEEAGEKGILRPIFEPGDALFFDELFLHQTALDPAMTETRYAIESWFFGGSGFPPKYAPVAV